MYSRLTPMKLLTFGLGIAACAVAAGAVIVGSNPKDGFWQLPGWITVILFAVGILMAVIGLLRRGEDGGHTHMSQSAGDSSVQNQAGGSIYNVGPGDSAGRGREDPGS